MLKLLGTVCILGACGFCGFSMAAGLDRREQELKALADAIDLIPCEIACRGSALPELCPVVARAFPGTVGQAFSALGLALRQPDPGPLLPLLAAGIPREMGPECRAALCALGRSLGAYDLDSQLSALDSAGADCLQRLEQLRQGKAQRMKCYRALGLCGGAALAILLL